MAENPKPPTSSEISTPVPNPQPPRRSRPRVREVSSRFMSPVTSSYETSSGPGDSHSHSTSSAKSPIIPNPNPRSVPSTPSDHLSRNHPLRRSNSVQRPRYADENRPDSVNRSSVSPVRTSKPRSAVKLFKEPSRTDTPVPLVGPAVGSRLARLRTWDSSASKLLQASGMSVSADHQGDSDASSVDGDCESVKSEPCENNSNSSSNGGDCLRVSTPVSRSMELPFSAHEQTGLLHSVKGGGHDEKVAKSMLMRSYYGSVKVARSLNLPPIPHPSGCLKRQGMVDVKKGVRKGSNQQEDVHHLRLLHNHYLQWRLANAKAEAAMIAQKRESEIQMYSLAVKISELQDSVKSKRAEVGFLQRTKTLSTVLDAQMPYLDEWSALEEDYSASLQALVQSLLDVSSQLPLVGNIKADVKEIEEALNWALKVIEMIFSQVQGFMPKAEQVGDLISDLARVCSGEIAHVEECGDLLSKTHLSQVEECSLIGQLVQLHTRSKEEQA